MTWLEVAVSPNTYSSIPPHVLEYIQNEATSNSTELSTFYRPSEKKLSIFVNASTGETLVKPPIHACTKYLSDCLWWELYDKRCHHLFYFNPLLKKSVWKKPPNGDIINLVHIQMAGENILECVLKDIILCEASIDEAQLSDIDMGLHNGRKSLRSSLEIASNDEQMLSQHFYELSNIYSSNLVTSTLTSSNGISASHTTEFDNDSGASEELFSFSGVDKVESLSEYKEDGTLKAKEPRNSSKVTESVHSSEPNSLDTKTLPSPISRSIAPITSTSIPALSSGRLHQHPNEMWFSSLDSGIPPDLSYTPATTLSSCCTQEEVEPDAELGGEEEEEADHTNCMEDSALLTSPYHDQPSFSSSIHNPTPLTSSCSSFVGDSASCPLQRKTLRLIATKTFADSVDLDGNAEANQEESPVDDPWVLQDCVLLRNSRTTSEWINERQQTGVHVKTAKSVLSRTSQASTVTHGSLSLLMDSMIASPSAQTLQHNHSRPNQDMINVDGGLDHDNSYKEDTSLPTTPPPPPPAVGLVRGDKNSATIKVPPHAHKSATPYKRSESCRTALPFLSHLRRRKTSVTRGDSSSNPSSQPSRTMPNSPLHHNTVSSTVASRSAESISNSKQQSAPHVYTINIVSPSSLNGIKTLTVQPCWHRSLLRSDQTMKKLLTWSKEPLAAPILLQTKKTLRKSACEVFRLIQMYMGDRKRSSRQTGGGDSGELELAQQILERGLQNPNLRDEILVQLCKQTTRNSNEMSVKHGWELFCLCVTHWSPSSTIFPYILGYVLTNQSHNHCTPHVHSNHNTDEFALPRDLVTPYAIASEERLLYPPPLDASSPWSPSAAIPSFHIQGGNGEASASNTHPRLRPSRSLSGSDINMDEVELHRQYLPYLRPFRSSLEQCISLPSPVFSPTVSIYEGVPWILPFLLKLIVQLNGLNTEGLFRNSGDMDAVSQLRRCCEKVLCPSSNVDCPIVSRPLSVDQIGLSPEVLQVCHNDPDVPANVLKQWLRELNPPLLAPLQSLEKIRNSPLSVEQLCSLLKSGRLSGCNGNLDEVDELEEEEDLPSVSGTVMPQLTLLQRQTLILLLAFLKVVCQQPYATKNRMQPGSLAIVLAPNLFQPCDILNYTEGMSERPFHFQQMDRQKAILELLIIHADTSGVDLGAILCAASDRASSSNQNSSDAS